MDTQGIVLLFLLLISVVALFLWANAEFRNRQAQDMLIKRTKELEGARRDVNRLTEENEHLNKKTADLEEAARRIGKAVRTSGGAAPELSQTIFMILSNSAPNTIAGMKRPKVDQHRSEQETKEMFRNMRSGMAGGSEK